MNDYQNHRQMPETEAQSTRNQSFMNNKGFQNSFLIFMFSRGVGKKTIKNFDSDIRKPVETLVVIKNALQKQREGFVYYDDDDQHQMDMSSNTFNSHINHGSVEEMVIRTSQKDTNPLVMNIFPGNHQSNKPSTPQHQTPLNQRPTQNQRQKPKKSQTKDKIEVPRNLLSHPSNKVNSHPLNIPKYSQEIIEEKVTRGIEIISEDLTSDFESEHEVPDSIQTSQSLQRSFQGNIQFKGSSDRQSKSSTDDRHRGHTKQENNADDKGNEQQEDYEIQAGITREMRTFLLASLAREKQSEESCKVPFQIKLGREQDNKLPQRLIFHKIIVNSWDRTQMAEIA